MICLNQKLIIIVIIIHKFLYCHKVITSEAVAEQVIFRLACCHSSVIQKLEA